MTGRIKQVGGMLALLGLCCSITVAEKLETDHPATEARLKADIFYLASNECEGRGPSTQGLTRASDYIASKFKEAGLKPANADGSYFQTFNLPWMLLEGPAKLTVTLAEGKPREARAAEDFQPMGLSSGGSFKDAPVVFAGYGIKSETLKYDDYANLDVRDKVVLVLRGHPREGKNDAKAWEQSVGTLTSKVQTAEKAGALAILIVNDKASADDPLLDFNFTAMLRGKAPPTKIPAFQVSRAFSDELLAKSGAKIADREEAISKDLKPQSTELKGVTLTGSLPSKAGNIPLRNVVGVVEGKGPLADETIVIGAHYDHLGYGGAGGSLARLKKAVTHNGADDNASGTTAMLELARRFAAQKDRQGRRLVFMAFSGEELGLLGSDYYSKNPLFPIEKTVAMFNLDMVGRMPKNENTGKDTLLVEANTTAKEWEELLDQWNTKHGFEMKRSKSIMPNSDHYSFYKKGMPVLFFWTGIHPDYHRPTDTAEKINITGMRRIVNISDDVIAHLGSTANPPKYQKTQVAGSGGRASGPKLGIVPGYTSDKEGVLLDDVTKDGPAEKAGLKKGDLIVELAGKPIKNIEGYMAAMATQKAGEMMDVGILRDGKKQTIKVKPE